jgi:hypothetical protein
MELAESKLAIFHHGLSINLAYLWKNTALLPHSAVCLRMVKEIISEFKKRMRIFQPL